MYHVTLIPGDGTGPELCEAARRCIDATGVPILWEIRQAGACTLQSEGTLLPESTLESIRRNKVALKGPILTPPGSGLRSVNVHLRQTLDLFACVRPCRLYPGVRSNYAGRAIDLVVVRENTEDLYMGIEYEADRPDTRHLLEFINHKSPRRLRSDSAVSVKVISESGSRRIAKFAFDYARRMGRRKVTVVHKANILRATDGLFLQTARAMAKDYGDIEFEDRIVDNMCMQLVARPEQYDVLVLPNLYGDIVSDLAAGLVGGLAVAPAANIGDKAAVFEAMHGAAPKHRGQNRVNPTALVLAGVVMLRHLGESEAAVRLDKAVAAVLGKGKSVTYDMKASRDDPSAVGTSQMADAIVAELSSL